MLYLHFNNKVQLIVSLLVLRQSYIFFEPTFIWENKLQMHNTTKEKIDQMESKIYL